MSYRIVGIPNRITIEEHPEGHNTLAQAYSRAKLLAGWPFVPNVRELTLGEVNEFFSARLNQGWRV